MSTKDKRQNQSIWHLIKTNIKVENTATGITALENNPEESADAVYYDISGRKAHHFKKNEVYISSEKKKFVVNQ